MKNRLKPTAEEKKNVKVVKLFAALRLRDPYAKRKLMRRLVAPALAFLTAASLASPAWAKKITDEELQAFLHGAPSTKTVEKKAVEAKPAAPAPVAAAPVAAKKAEAAPVPVAAKAEEEGAALMSKEGELKVLKPKAVAKKARKATDIPEVDPEEEKSEGQTLTVEGQVSAKNNYGLGVEFEADEVKGSAKESWFNLTKSTKFSGIKGLDELEEGDRVSVVFKKLHDSGKKLPQRISLVSRKPAEAPALPAAQ